ncbi:MAG: hypothetical protein ACYCX5_04115 [Coriobacteriia bacterium]
MRFNTHKRALVLVAILVTAAVSRVATATIAEAAPAPEQTVSVRVEQPVPSLAPDGIFRADVVTTLGVEAEYFEVRLRIKSPSGSLLYQKTEVRHNVPAGPQVTPFSRDLSGLGASQGRYPIEVRVLATGANATEATSRILVMEPGATRVPVTVIARLTCSPAIDPAGRFVADPELYPRSRTDAERIADVLERHTDAPVALALPPILVEEWLRASDGYELSGPEGISTVPESGTAAIGSAQVIERMRDLLADGRTALLDIPYAEPDLANMAGIDALGDLRSQWAMSDTVMSAALGAEPTSGTAFSGNVVPLAALTELERRTTSFVVLAAESLDSGDTTATSGAYALEGSDVHALVIEPALADAAARSDTDAFYDVIFDRLISKNPGDPLVLVFDVGPGTAHTAADLERALDLLDNVGWITAVPASRAAGYPSARTATLVESPAALKAPEGYWAEVARAREYAGAIVSALGSADADAQAAQTAVLVAESQCWAGPDASYSLADRGRAFAASASRYVQDLFATVSIQGHDVTLSDRKGNAPLSVINGSGKPLKVIVRAQSGVISLPRSETTVTLDPGENVLTIPVNMGSELADDVDVRVTAGAISIAETSIRVQASYLDRLATVGMVVLFLLGLLFFIRRRVRRAIAGTIDANNEETAARSDALE